MEKRFAASFRRSFNLVVTYKSWRIYELIFLQNENFHQNFRQNFFSHAKQKKSPKISIKKVIKCPRWKRKWQIEIAFFPLSPIAVFWMSLQFSVCHFKTRDVSLSSVFNLPSQPFHRHRCLWLFPGPEKSMKKSFFGEDKSSQKEHRSLSI